MTAVFVHGVPETSSVWDGLRARLGGDTVALELPGFGGPRPHGFRAAKEDYVRWLEEALLATEGPIDLVGHDWGALLVARVAAGSRVPLRSWAVDVGGVLHPDYEWHAAARLWQTSGAGEEWVRTAVGAAPGAPEGTAAQLVAAGVGEEHAKAMAAAFDETMAVSILDLYRSATPNVFASWSRELSAPTSAPGLVLQPSLDPFDDIETSSAVAARLGARTETLTGLGHWWMLERPDAAADALERFWARPRL